MKPIKHPSNTRTLGAPVGWDQSGLPVEPLGITDTELEGVPCVMSFWQPDDVDLANIAAGGLIGLSIVGRTMPPACVVTLYPADPARGDVSTPMSHLVQASEKDYHAALQRVGAALGLPAGSDLTKACVPAIEELRQAHPVHAAKGRPTLPPMSEALRDLLGTPVHTMIPLVRCLQAAGLDIPRTYEGEQAGMLYWMLGFYLEHGDDWRSHARVELTRLQEAMRAAQPSDEEKP